MKFQIGDRVVLVSECADINHTPNHNIPHWSTGTIVDVLRDSRYGVSFDGCKSGHHCRNRLTGDKSRSGYYVDEEELALIDQVAEDVFVNIDSLL